MKETVRNANHQMMKALIQLMNNIMWFPNLGGFINFPR